jgi:hypothetical protein
LFEFNKLNQEKQSWYQEITFIKKRQKPRRSLRHLRQTTIAETTVITELTATETIVTKRGPTAAPAPTETTKKAKPPVKIEAAKKSLSMSRALKDIVVREPRISTDELYARLDKVGFTGRSKVTVATLRSDTLTTLAAAHAGLYTVDME